MDIINRFFFIFYMGNTFQSKKWWLYVHTPEWKFKANIARNARLPDLGQKFQKTDYKNFTLVSQS